MCSFLPIGCFCLTLTTTVKVGFMKSHDQTTDMVRAFMMNVLVYRILKILDKEVGGLDFDTCCTLIAMCLSDK